MGNSSYSDEPVAGLETLNVTLSATEIAVACDTVMKKGIETVDIVKAILSTDKMKPITTQDMIEQGYVYAKACPLVGQPVWYKKEYQDALLDTICYNYSYYPHAKTIVYTSPAYGVLRKQINTVKDIIEFYDFLESVQRVGETAR